MRGAASGAIALSFRSTLPSVRAAREHGKVRESNHPSASEWIMGLRLWQERQSFLCALSEQSNPAIYFMLPACLAFPFFVSQVTELNQPFLASCLSHDSWAKHTQIPCHSLSFFISRMNYGTGDSDSTDNPSCVDLLNRDRPGRILHVYIAHDFLSPRPLTADNRLLFSNALSASIESESHPLLLIPEWNISQNSETFSALPFLFHSLFYLITLSDTIRVAQDNQDTRNIRLTYKFEAQGSMLQSRLLCIRA